jgi:hypothetical protein
MDGTIAQLDKICDLEDEFDDMVHHDDCHAKGFMVRPLESPRDFAAAPGFPFEKGVGWDEAAASDERVTKSRFFRNGFRVCLNTDDRLMSDTTMTKETILATELFDLSLADLEKLNLNAIKSAFAPYGKRLEVIFDTIKPGYAALWRQ